MNMKKLLAAVLAMTLMLAAAGAYAQVYTANTIDELKTMINNAESGDVVKLGTDLSTDESWSHVAVPSGVTLEGDGKTLTVNNIYHGSGNYIFSGSDYVVQNMTISSSDTSDGICISGGRIENVTFKGNLGSCIIADNGTKVLNCTFAGRGWGIYTEPDDMVSEVIGCTFNSPRAVALYGSETFSGNTVNGDKGLSVATTNATIKDNTFSGDRAISVSKTGASISGNAFLNNSAIEVDPNCSVDLTNNYWGGDKTLDDRVKPQGTNVKFTIDSVFETISELNVFLGKEMAAVGNVSMPSTGDGSMLMLWAALLALCGAGMAAMKRAKA